VYILLSFITGSASGSTISLTAAAEELIGRGWVFLTQKEMLRLVAGSEPPPTRAEHPTFDQEAVVITLAVDGKGEGRRGRLGESEGD